MADSIHNVTIKATLDSSTISGSSGSGGASGSNVGAAAQTIAAGAQTTAAAEMSIALKSLSVQLRSFAVTAVGLNGTIQNLKLISQQLTNGFKVTTMHLTAFSSALEKLNLISKDMYNALEAASSDAAESLNSLANNVSDGSDKATENLSK